MLFFLQANADISEVEQILVPKFTFSDTNIHMYIQINFQDSSTILIIIRQGVILPPPLPQNKPLKRRS